MAEARLKYPIDDQDRVGSSLVKFRFSNNEGGVGAGTNTPTGVVDMYVPNGLQLTDQIQYSNTELGIGGQALLQGDQGSFYSGIWDELRGTALNEDTSFLEDVASVITRSASALGRLAASGVGPDAITGAIGRRSGRIINPNLKATFRGVDVRNYSFTFNMIPASSQEANAVDAIVRKFRSAAYPATVASTSNSDFNLFLKYPEKVEVIVYTSPAGEDGTESYQIKFKESFITNISVTRNPTSTTYHADGAPVETQLTVTLSESEILTKEDIDGGY